MRKPKFVQFIPDRVVPMFQVVEPTPGETYWHARIADAIQGDEPEFRYTPPKKGNPFTVQELANRVAGELNEARGTIFLQEVVDGIPVFSATFASNSRQVMCVRSTDPARAQPIDLTVNLREVARKAIADYRAKRANG